MNDLQTPIINLEEKQNTSLIWQNIKIDVSFDPIWLKPHGLVHITINSEHKVRLPVTHTGFLSAYFPFEFVSEYSSIEDFISEWLNEFAQLKEWQAYLNSSRQLSLF